MIPPATTQDSDPFEPAPAKVNLFLHVTGRRADGYHLLDSLVVFAGIGDALHAAPADGLTLAVRGPEAGALAAEGDNLVLRAARALAEAAGRPPRALLRLEKRLPVASGIGGGSADAAAALRLLGRLWGVGPGTGARAETAPGTVAPAAGGRRAPGAVPPDAAADPAAVTPGATDPAAMTRNAVALDAAALDVLALGLGADVPACLRSVPLRMGGVGEAIAPAPPLPTLGLVLANPRLALSTPAVFRARGGGFSRPMILPDAGWATAASLAGTLRAAGNDLEAPAVALCPPVEAVLAALRATPRCLLARMSGSGATCFALYPGPAEAEAAAAALPAAWWRWGGGLHAPAG